ncbi:MerR family transcriptional regulator [Kribbella sp. NPDC050124]|uniref:MerR family transcriptional regulator n=1 Tax=Kribbella sp. NPDC050124 TaxID=3364114 RepID=UPI00378A03B9
MVNIGEFARLGGVSTRMLRHYDAIGVLKPAHVDPSSGRRSYDVTQLATLNRLVALKGLGFSLDEIGRLLGEGVDPAEMKGMLRLRQAEFERRVRHDRHILDRVTARLRLIEQETRMNTTIETKQADAVTIASLSATAIDASPQSTGHVLRDLFDQVIERMEAVHADRTTPVAWFISADGRASVEVIAGYALPGDSVPGLQARSLPVVEVASTIHQGPMSGIATAYQELARWAEANGHHKLLESPRWRQHFLEADGDDETHWIVELQLELT